VCGRGSALGEDGSDTRDRCGCEVEQCAIRIQGDLRGKKDGTVAAEGDPGDLLFILLAVDLLPVLDPEGCRDPLARDSGVRQGAAHVIDALS